MINTLSKQQHFRVWDKRHNIFMDEEEFLKDIILYPSGFKHEVRMGQFYTNSQEMNGVNEVKIENGHYLHSLPTKRCYICLAQVIGNLLETPELLKLDVQRQN